ncbi:MAG: SIMPL domain-containing protein [Fibrobacteraceae bacterium]
MKINLLCSVSLAAALALAGCCSSTPSAETGTIKVSAYHTEDFAPDAITWSLSVSIKGQNKDSLVTELKKRVTALTAFADSIGVPKDSLVTQQFSLDKDWTWNEGKQIFNGYQISQNITATLSDPVKASKFSEGLAHIADIEIQDMTPTVKDRQAKENKVIQLATKEATAKAQALAEAAGVKLGRVYAISDEPITQNYSRKRGVMLSTGLLNAAADGAGAGNDIFLSQKITLGSTVYIEFEIK